MRSAITSSRRGGVPPAGLAYPFVCEGVPAKDRPADIVVINHGCNDGGVPNIENGYRNLIKLVSSGYTDGFYYKLGERVAKAWDAAGLQRVMKA